MSAICGIFHRDGRPVPPESIGAMTAALDHWQSDETGTWRNPSGCLALGHVKLANTPESLAERQPFLRTAAGLTITADARLDNREDLFRELGIPLPDRAGLPDSQLILLSYEKWGRGCAAHLLGDFAFAIWDERERRLFCARDHLGCKPFFYFLSPDAFVFATEMKGIFRAVDLPRTLSEFWIADSLAVHVADKEYTPYPDLRRLPPAHWFSVADDGLQREIYWRPDPEKEIRLSSEAEYVQAFREKLAEAVRCRTRSLFPLGAELSGGLDSSTVSALAVREAEARSLDFFTFSNVLDEESSRVAGLDKDEQEYQEQLRRHARIGQWRSLTPAGSGILASLRNTLQEQDGPTHRAYGVDTEVLRRLATETGVRTMLSGFGGDEVVSHPAGEYFQELVRGREWGKLWREFRHPRAAGQRRTVLHLLAHAAGEYLPWVKRCLPGNGRNSRGCTDDRWLTLFPLAPEFFLKPGIRQRLLSINRLPSGISVRESQGRRLLHTHLPVRLEGCSVQAAACRMEYRYPLLDVRLLEFHLAVPSFLKRKNGYGRWLFRRALDGVVPPTIQWRNDKTGAAVPGVRQGIVRDAAAIERLIRRARNGPGGDYVNLEQLLTRLRQAVPAENGRGPLRQGVFLAALKVLLWFDAEGCD